MGVRTSAALEGWSKAIVSGKLPTRRFPTTELMLLSFAVYRCPLFGVAIFELRPLLSAALGSRRVDALHTAICQPRCHAPLYTYLSSVHPTLVGYARVVACCRSSPRVRFCSSHHEYADQPARLELQALALSYSARGCQSTKRAEYLSERRTAAILCLAQLAFSASPPDSPLYPCLARVSQIRRQA